MVLGFIHLIIKSVLLFYWPHKSQSHSQENGPLKFKCPHLYLYEKFASWNLRRKSLKRRCIAVRFILPSSFCSSEPKLSEKKIPWSSNPAILLAWVCQYKWNVSVVFPGNNHVSKIGAKRLVNMSKFMRSYQLRD